MRRQLMIIASAFFASLLAVTLYVTRQSQPEAEQAAPQTKTPSAAVQASRDTSPAPSPASPPPATEAPSKGLSLAQQVAAIKQLHVRGDISALRAYLEAGQNPLLQDAAMEALTALEAREALPQIASLASSQDEFVLTQVMKSLGSLAGRSPEEADKVFAIEQLQSIYQRWTKDLVGAGPKPELHQSNAIEALGLVPHRLSVDFLLGELKAKEGDPYMQYFIVSSLGRMADPRALAALDSLAARLPKVAQPKSEEELTVDALGAAIAKAKNNLINQQ